MINTPLVINPHATQPTSLLALFKSLARNRQLIVQMTKREVVGRYKGSALGLAWSFFNPIFMLVVYTFVISAGCGGKVFCDFKPTLRYRLHAANLVGANFSWPARLKRLRMLWQGRFRNWNDSNIAALRKLESKLTPENRIILERFAKARQMSLVFRLINLKRNGIHRQTILGNVGLIVAEIFGVFDFDDHSESAV